MRIVLFDDETFEAITILDMIGWRELSLPVGVPIRVPVPTPMTVEMVANSELITDPIIKVVTIRFMDFHRTDQRYGRRSNWLGFTDDPESALLLRSVFLPGQQSAMRRREQEAYAEGFMAALRKVLGA